MLIRGFYYEGWKLSRKPVRERHKEEFLAHVKDAIQGDERVDPEGVARAVFQLVARRISVGEIKDIKHLMPRGLRICWPAGVCQVPH